MNTQIELLHERVLLMEKVNDANIDGIMVFTTGLTAMYWNKTSEVLTGISRDEAIGRHINDLFPTFINNKEIQNAIEHTLKGRKTFVPHEKCADSNGYFERHFVPLLSQDDEVTGILSIVHDAAQRVKIENELKSLNKSLVKKNKELRQTNAELGAFAHVTSHELKEPLRKIYSLTEQLQNQEAGTLSDSGKLLFKRIQGAAQRMHLLTDDILAYSEISAQKEDLKTIDLNILMLHVINAMQQDITKKGASIKLDELATFKGYNTLLETLFGNLISNALKFQKEGMRPEIIITSEELTSDEIAHPDVVPDTKYLRISLTDNGIGIEEKKKDQIFQMFYRLQPQLYPGTGIGLPVCKKIAELHGGFITADSRESGGSIFNVFLPIGKS